MMKFYGFSSAYEITNQELSRVADSLLNGLKLKVNNNEYIVGDLALREGSSPHKIINSGPMEEEYQLLMQAGLLLAASQGDKPLNLTLGFPFSTYALYNASLSTISTSISAVSPENNSLTSFIWYKSHIAIKHKISGLDLPSSQP